MTSNDLWPPQKTIGIIYLIWHTHTLTVRSLTVTTLEIQRLQGFDLLIPGDPIWPLNSTKNNRDHLLIMTNSHTKYEIYQSYPSWDRAFTSKASHTLTYSIYTHTHMNTHSHNSIDSSNYFKESITSNQHLKYLKTPYGPTPKEHLCPSFKQIHESIWEEHFKQCGHIDK